MFPARGWKLVSTRPSTIQLPTKQPGMRTNATGGWNNRGHKRRRGLWFAFALPWLYARCWAENHRNHSKKDKKGAGNGRRRDNVINQVQPERRSKNRPYCALRASRIRLTTLCSCIIRGSGGPGLKPAAKKQPGTSCPRNSGRAELGPAAAHFLGSAPHSPFLEPKDGNCFRAISRTHIHLFVFHCKNRTAPGSRFL